MTRAKTKRPGTRGKRAESVPATEPYEKVEIRGATEAELEAALAELPRPMTLDDSQLVEETMLPELPTLRFAVLEDDDHLAPAQAAIAAAGHIVVAGAAVRDGVMQILELVRDGDVDTVLVGIPGGEPIIDAALALEPRRPVVIAALSGAGFAGAQRASATGADLASTRPHDVDRLAPILLAAARLHIERSSAISARGSERVLRARLEELADPDPRGLQPFELFQRVLELEIKRAKRFDYPLSVALFGVDIPQSRPRGAASTDIVSELAAPPAGILGILRARAGNALINSIRDIDLATQLDHERFLVLLPYTDITGATSVARRVIAAVANGDPVVSSGRSFVPRLVAAIAGARGDESLSFAKLMKDATRALEQARRDGAELAVQP